MVLRYKWHLPTAAGDVSWRAEICLISCERAAPYRSDLLRAQRERTALK